MKSATYGKGGDRLLPTEYGIGTWNLMLSTLTINILSLAVPAMTLQIYDRIIPNPSSGTLPILITGVCVAILLETILRLGRAYGIGWAGASYEHRLSCKIINHFLKTDLSAPPSCGTGEYMNRMESVSRLKDFYNGYSLIVLFELLFIPLFLALIIYIAGILVAVPAAILTLFMLIAYGQGKKLRGIFEERDEADEKRYNFLIESLDGIHTLKSFGQEQAFARRYEYLKEKSTIENFKATSGSAKSFDTSSVFSNLMITGVVAFGALLVLGGNITTGALIATILLSGRIMQPVQRALALWTHYQDFSVARKKVESFFAMPVQPFVKMTETSPPAAGALSIENLSFRAYDDGPLLFNAAGLSLGHGECVSISAAMPAALTALLDMIAGLYPPTGGAIKIDGENILHFAPQEIIRHVGYIQKDGIIFRGTIRDNLTCFGKLNNSHVQEISALLKVDKEIACLPSGFDTFLSGTVSDSIPPGLKQRISIVRALASKPRLILFDGADKSLDREGYNLVYNLLAKLAGKATIILSTDDHNLLSQASHHFYIEQGAIKEIPLHARKSAYVPHKEAGI
ncbi:MAG: ABC transporter transmembrane domain-containing protein [Micavibrio sp.]